MLKVRLASNTKVCHVTSVHNRYDVRIFHKECKSLAKKGFDVTLLVNDMLEDELNDGVKIKSTLINVKSRFERMFGSIKIMKKKAIEIDATIYHFHDPELLPLATYFHRKGKIVIFDFHEDVSQQILFKTWIPRIFRKIVASFYKVYEKRHVKTFNGLITVTPKFVERLKSINPNTLLVTNYPIINKFINNYDNEKNNSICFAGGISSQWNHKNIIKAVEQLSSINYILAGSSTNEYLNTLKNLDGWSKVNYLGRIPHEEVKNIYRDSIAGMTLLSNNTQVGDEGTLGNTKIFEFMESGLPIICSNNKLWNEIIEEFKCGIAVDPNNIIEIKQAILKLIQNPEKTQKMGINGRKAVEMRFNWKTQEDNLVEFYNRLLN